MTVAERLDQIQMTPGGRERAAALAAGELSDVETLELLALLLGTAPGVSVGARHDGEAEILISRARHRAIVRLGIPDERALIVLRDRNVGLLSTDCTLRTIWGPPLILDSATLLLGIQYVRDKMDENLYERAEGALAALRRRAAEWGLPFDMLLDLSTRRGDLVRVDQPRAA